MFNEQDDAKMHHNMFDGLIGLLKFYGLSTGPFARIIDLGGGHGSAAPFLQTLGGRVCVADVLDYGSFESGTIYKALKDRSKRLGYEIDLSRIEFNFNDAMDLSYKDNYFDFFYSMNAFEHIPNPMKAWTEIGRVGKSGAIVAAQFDPIWTSAYGHHLFNLPFDPWDHLVLSEELFEQKIWRLGGGDADVAIFREAMNRVPFHEHRAILEIVKHDLMEEAHFDYWDKSPSDTNMTSHPNFKDLIDRGYKDSDLIVRGFNFVGRLK